MGNILIENLQKEVKVGFVLAVAERVFSIISKDDERYPDGRKPWTNVGYGLNLMLLLGMNYMSLLITQTLQEFQNLQRKKKI